MKKFVNLLLAAVLVATMILPIACTPAEQKPQEAKGTFSYITNENMSSSTEYNKNLYYLNQLNFQIADPDVIYIDHGEEAGWFYAYGTSDLVNCYGIQCWRSRDLTNWEYKGVAYQPDFDTAWDYTNHWAPEVRYDAEQDLYLMFFNADKIVGYNGDTPVTQKYIDVVYSDSPYGPFVTYYPENPHPAYDFTAANSEITDKSITRSYAIDVHPFVDPVSGKKYLYYSGYGNDGTGVWHGQTIFGVEMIDWLTPDYSTLKELTHLYYTTTKDEVAIDEGRQAGASVNEGPYVYYKDGTYYMTFSVYPYTQEMYQVRQAIATSPLGDYTKLQPGEGGQIIATDGAWSGFLSSAGHHAFIKCGDQLMIAYHTFYNRTGIDGGRALAVDTISFIDNGNGQKVMHANGPTYSYQPLPSEISGYGNIADQAEITVNNAASDNDVSWLTDGVLKVHGSDPKRFFERAEWFKVHKPLYYRNNYLGEVTGTGGGIFDNVEERIITDAEIENLPFLYYGLDFGFEHPQTFEVAYYDEDTDTLYCVAEVFAKRCKNSTFARKIKKYIEEEIICDSARPDAIAEMQDWGFNAIGAKKRWGSGKGRDYCWEWLQQTAKIVVDPERCPHLAHELTTLEHEQLADGSFSDAYPKIGEDCTMALIYGLNRVIMESRRNNGLYDDEIDEDEEEEDEEYED